jgi:hypothetical protein
MTEVPKEVPKIVYDRLRAGRPEPALPERAHPGADLLTAFAEQALSATERDRVLEHLALCGDCREVIALALPDADAAAAPIADETDAIRATGSQASARVPHKLIFSWPGLHWAALAAGVVVVASVLLIRPGKLNQTTPPSANPQVATNAQPVSGTQIASSQIVSPQISSSPIVSPPVGQSAIPAKTGETPPKSELQFPRKFKAVAPSPPAESGMLLAENKKESAPANQLPAAPTVAGQAFAFDASTSGAATEADTVEVSKATPAAEPAPSIHGNLMARNEAPAIEKAKPAPQEMGVNAQQKTDAAVPPPPVRSQARNAASAGKMAFPAMRSPASPALAPRVTWAITAGALQRSLDSGQSWQNALRPDHPLLCYASHGADVWTGGQAGTLFRSADGGVTWEQVQPAVKGQQLSADITHIDVRGPAEVIVSTSDNETWSSVDGGKTWGKK